VNVTIETPAIETGSEQQRPERSGRRNRNNRRGRRDENGARETNRPFVPNDEVTANQAALVVETNAAPLVVEVEPIAAATQVIETNNTEVTVEAKPAKPKNEGRKPKSAKPVAEPIAENQVEVIATVDTEAGKATAPAESKRPARARKPKAEAKPIDLASVGLQLVETKADAPKAVVVETPAPSGPRKVAAWQKKAKEEISAEPLVMVETQK
jgi:ribonuclease E